MSKANTGSPGQNCQFNISCTSGGPASRCYCTQKCSYYIFKRDKTKGSIENDIALRQIVMKDVKDKSWFMFVRDILHICITYHQSFNRKATLHPKMSGKG